MLTMKGENIPVLHAVVVPFPAQGHINALIHFANLLHGRGFFITFVNTEWTEKRMFGSSKNVFPRSTFRFLSFADGLPPEHGRTSHGSELLQALVKCGPALEDVLRSNSESGVPPVTCIVTDFCLSCTASVAANMGVARVVFWPLCAAISITQKYAHLLLSQGHIPVKVSRVKSPEIMISSLPGNIPNLWPSDLLSVYRDQYESKFIYKALFYESKMSNKGDYVLVNTFDELEGRETAMALSINGCPALAIGPVCLPNFLQGKKSKLSSMWEEDESCLEWLDKQHPRSVLYVSFGSVAMKTQDQLEELALGLEGSGHAFLWVLRSDIAQGKSAILPEGFKERTMDRALFVQWAPQLKVLAHPSVGGFLTHSGWNSTLESMSMGVPLLGWPYCSDQFLNCRFTKEIWKVGLDFKDVDVDENRLVTRKEVEIAVRRIMQSEKLRKKALELKEAATKAVMPGGSSFININTFIEDMIKKSKPSSSILDVHVGFVWCYSVVIYSKSFSQDGAQIQLKSLKLGIYLVAEDGGGQNIVVNGNRMGDFQTWHVKDEVISLECFNKQFVGANNGRGGIVNAVATTSSTWETFQIIRNPSDPKRVHIKVLNGMYMQATSQDLLTADFKGESD